MFAVFIWRVLSRHYTFHQTCRAWEVPAAPCGCNMSLGFTASRYDNNDAACWWNCHYIWPLTRPGGAGEVILAHRNTHAERRRHTFLIMTGGPYMHQNGKSATFSVIKQQQTKRRMRACADNICINESLSERYYKTEWCSKHGNVCIRVCVCVFESESYLPDSHRNGVCVRVCVEFNIFSQFHLLLTQNMC